MNRTEKKELIEDVNAKLKASTTLVVTQYRGLTVAEMSDLRRKMRAAGAGFKVSKNRLVKLAAVDTSFAPLSDMLKGPTAVAFSSDPVAAAKGVVEFAKINEKLVIIGGMYGEQMLDKKAIEALAKLPSLDELRAKIVGMLKTPATRIACVLQAPGSQVARVIAAKASKED
jgi:large subunit ribosomal protein L10